MSNSPFRNSPFHAETEPQPSMRTPYMPVMHSTRTTSIALIGGMIAVYTVNGHLMLQAVLCTLGTRHFRVESLTGVQVLWFLEKQNTPVFRNTTQQQYTTEYK